MHRLDNSDFDKIFDVTQSKMFKPKQTSDSTEKKQSAQSAFTEKSIREGFTLEDIKMWQALCRSLALLGDDAEEAMHGVLSICDMHGLSPLTVCMQIRSLGFPSIEEGITAAFEHFGLAGVDEQTDGGDSGDDARDDHDPDADQDDRVEDEGEDRPQSRGNWKRGRFQTQEAIDDDEE